MEHNQFENRLQFMQICVYEANAAKYVNLINSLFVQPDH
jgi:hypothetical protein